MKRNSAFSYYLSFNGEVKYCGILKLADTFFFARASLVRIASFDLSGFVDAICQVLPSPQEVTMKRTQWLQETRKMRFEEAHTGWLEGRLTQAELRSSERAGKERAAIARGPFNLEVKLSRIRPDRPASSLRLRSPQPLSLCLRRRLGGSPKSLRRLPSSRRRPRSCWCR